MILRDDHDADWTAAADAALERRVYYAQNWRADVVALMADNGRVLERTWYEAYGTPHSSPAADLTGSVDSNSDFYGVPDGILDSVDSSYYLTLYSSSDARADLSGSTNPASAAYGRPDGTVDSVDYFFYLAIYAEGATAGRGVLSQADVRNRKGYAGYEWDPGVQAATMVFHVRNRVLMTETGRWSRRDPLGYVDGMSLYAYVSDRPVANGDPNGTLPLNFSFSFGWTRLPQSSISLGGTGTAQIQPGTPSPTSVTPFNNVLACTDFQYSKIARNRNASVACALAARAAISACCAARIGPPPGGNAVWATCITIARKAYSKCSTRIPTAPPPPPPPTCYNIICSKSKTWEECNACCMTDCHPSETMDCQDDCDRYKSNKKLQFPGGPPVRRLWPGPAFPTRIDGPSILRPVERIE